MNAIGSNGSAAGSGGDDGTTIKLRISTTPRSAAPAHAPSGWAVKAEFTVGTARDGGAVETLALAGDDVLEITLDDGTSVYLRADEAEQWLSLNKPSRDAMSGAVALDLGVAISALPGEGTQRDGILKWAIKSFRVFGEGPAAMTAVTLAGSAQDKVLGTEPGMYRCDTARFALTPVQSIAAVDGPLLLFIHGTASSTQGSFGHLWSGNAEYAAALFKPYGDRVYALQHRTLTESPIRNALDAALALPAGARLHIVSHSRGGMVGELLARGGNTGAEPIDAADVALVSRDGAETAKALGELRDVLRSKRIVVERFVRVACPARGTTLASGRLDRWANVALNLMRFATTKIAGLATSIVAAPLGGAVAASVDSGLDAFNSFLLAVVKERTNATALPGLEAMMPESATVKMLNRAGVNVAGKLYVIAGDYQGSTLLTRFGNWLSDTFYGGENDLVVNTASMTGGAARVDGMWRAYFQGPHTHHLRYFEEADSRRQLQVGLEGNLHGYERWDGHVEPPIARSARKHVDPQTANSIAFLLPGIMGSHLGIPRPDGSFIDRIWFDPIDLAGGNIKRLQVGGAEDGQVTTDGMFDSFYGALRERLAASHAVIDFPYDWRRSLRDEGLSFGVELERALANPGRSVRIVAHSMGGLVARMAFARTDGLWERFAANPANRILMLGTPNQGSHSIVSVLLGRDDFIRKIERWFDYKHDMREFLEYVSGFPGVLELLPAPSSRPERDYFDIAQWEDVLKPNDEQANGEPKCWFMPHKDKLAAARATWELLEHWLARNPTFAHKVHYVAGQSPTPHEVKVEKGQLEILLTPQGDGRVPWQTGLLGGLISKVWYADCSHGDLPAYEDAFDGYLELLETGNTSRLPATPPAARAAVTGVPVPERLPQRSQAQAEIFPSSRDIMAAAIGARPRIRRRKVLAPPELKVTIKHGSFGYSEDAVMIGHYEGDTIEGSEAYLDRLLSGKLARSRDLGVHPHQPGDAAVFLADDEYGRPRGAVVVGLGRLGELTPGELTRTVRQGALAYVNRVSTEPHAAKRNDPTRIATVIVGSGYYGLSVRDALAAILMGLQEANTILARQSDRRLAPIAAVSIFERRLDRALSAITSAARLAMDTRFRRSITIEPVLTHTPGGYQATQVSDIEGSWQRIQVIEHKGVLSFTVLSDGARNNIDLQVTQPGLIEQLIDRTIAHTEENVSRGRALFELLIPAGLKQGAPESYGIAMMVDQATARYPWEMLRDAAPDARESLPLAARIGFVRSFHGVGLVTSVQHPKERTALVVGDPTGPLKLPEFVPLPGARSEAERVANALGDHGYRITKEISSESQTTGRGADIVTTLVGNEFRILHLSGHGVVNFATSAGTTISGMALDRGIFLTKAEVDALPYVPELVFINCCHLGRFADAAQLRAFDIGRATLATGLAEAFVRKGAKAVIAAGWAVDDDAAVTFAETFYARFLDGVSFGDALRQAREETYRKHPSVNTWGAYQAYGNKDYRMTTRAPGDTAGTPSRRYFDAHQVLEELGTIRADAEIAASDAIKQLIERLAGIEAELAQDAASKPSARLAANAQLQETMGHAFADVGEFAKALEYFKKVLMGGQKNVSMRLFEQRANMLARHGWNLIRLAGSDKTQQQAGLKKIDAGIDAAKTLCDFMPTAERWSILASAYKRKALGVSIVQPAEVDAALKEMTRAYGEALTINAKDEYAFLNWVQGHVLASSTDEPAKEAIARIEAIAQREGGNEYWDLTYPADAALTLRLRAALSTKPVKHAAPPSFDKVKERYTDLLRRAGSPRESASVLDQLDALRRLTARAGAASGKSAQAIADELTQLFDALSTVRK